MANNIGTLRKILESRISNENIEKILTTAGKKVHGDIVALAPVDTGTYASSIQLSEVVHEGSYHYIKVFTNLNSGWNNVPLGCLLEWGTGIKGEQTNTYEHGFPYRQTPWVYYNEKLGHFVFTHGNVAKPHFAPGLYNNESYFKKVIKEGVARD